MRFLTSAHLQFLFEGVLWTIGLSLLAFLGGGLLGFLVALADCRTQIIKRRIGFAVA
jgi:polar amino acid transport system permease protein